MKYKMKYKMKVKIVDPNTKEGMSSGLYFDLNCYFIYDSEQCGNGYLLYIYDNNNAFKWQSFDLRYDKSFNPHNKVKWVEEWAKTYWDGNNGAWVLKAFEIVEVNNEN